MNNTIKQGRLNILFGTIAMLAAAMGGMALGATFDQHAVRDGDHVLTLVRFYLREGHSHGMPLAMLNMVIGLIIDQWFSSEKLKKICSYSAMLSLVLPIGLASKGAAGAAANFPPFGMIGVIALFVTLICLLLGYRKI